MNCSRCGTENRVGARICKQCGQPLAAAPAAPPPVAPPSPVAAPSPIIQACANCGAPLKPGKRFCTRCGADKTAAPAAHPAQAPAYPPTVPAPGMQTPPAQPQYAEPPMPIPPVTTAGAASQNAEPLPAPKTKTKFPMWIVWAGVAGLVLCIVLAVLAMVFNLPERLMPTPIVTPTATLEPTPTATPTEESAPPPASETPPTDPIQVLLENSPSEISIGSPVTLTVTIQNTTGVTLTNVSCQLSGSWYPYLEVDPIFIDMDTTDQCVFTMTGKTSGLAHLQIYVYAQDHPNIPLSNEVTMPVQQSED